jgi:hypothetical protein
MGARLQANFERRARFPSIGVHQVPVAEVEDLARDRDPGDSSFCPFEPTR